MVEYTLRGHAVRELPPEADAEYGILMQVEEMEDDVFVRTDEIHAENLRDDLAFAVLREMGEDAEAASHPEE